MNHNMNEPKITDFTVGDPVTYIPNHANGDASHPDCERGHVSSIRDNDDKHIWVRFNSTSGQCCDITNLRH